MSVLNAQTKNIPPNSFTSGDVGSDSVNRLTIASCHHSPHTRLPFSTLSFSLSLSSDLHAEPCALWGYEVPERRTRLLMLFLCLNLCVVRELNSVFNWEWKGEEEKKDLVGLS
jgi:hypothetical protein